MQSLLILGRQPALGLAELESLYGSANLRPIGTTAALLGVPAEAITFPRLGGTIKLGTVLTTFETIDWRAIESQLMKFIPEQAVTLPDGKLTIGLSAIGYPVSAGQLNALGLSLKKAIRKHAPRPVRLVPNKEAELNSAQVFHNNLTAERGWELLIVRDGNQTILARTTAVQDIDDYTHRDRDRPKRDTRVGMLPPKLAQTIINLAAGPATGTTNSSKLAPRASSLVSTVLDPFCGTGVLLQEALLMGYRTYGTDLEPRMIEYSQINLDWLGSNYHLAPSATATLEPGDATSYRWNQTVDIVAGESYLGKPFTATPTPAALAATVSDCNLIISKFLRNIHSQLRPGTRLCLAVPAWQVRPGQFKHLQLVDSLEKMGYNQVRFEYARNDQLLYYREDQIVARELLVLTKQ